MDLTKWVDFNDVQGTINNLLEIDFSQFVRESQESSLS